MGHDKLNPSVTMFELDVEEKGPNKQITEMFLRPTNGRQGLGTGSKNEYSMLCMERGTRNIGQELHEDPHLVSPSCLALEPPLSS